MGDGRGEPIRLGESWEAWRAAARQMLENCPIEQPAQVPTLARAALAGDDGATMTMEDALAGDACAVLPLLLDHLFAMMQEVDDHFYAVARIAQEKALTMDPDEVRGVLMRERDLLLPAVELAEVLAGMLGDEGAEPLGDLLAYRTCADGLGGRRVSRAVRAAAKVALLVEHGIASRYPGRCVPEGPLVDEARVTKWGPYIQLEDDEAGALIAAVSGLPPRTLEGKRQLATVIQTLDLSTSYVRDLDEYDPDAMDGCSFLPKRHADALARAGVWAKLHWAGVTGECRDYERAVLLLAGVFEAPKRHMMMGVHTVAVEAPPTISRGRGSLADLLAGRSSRGSRRNDDGVDLLLEELTWKFSPHVAEADLSVLFYEGEEAVVLSPYGPDGDLGYVSVWPVASLAKEAALLIGSLAGEVKPEEAALQRERWRWLKSFRFAPEVRAGKAPLTDEHLRYLGVGIGDDLVVVGLDDHAELWNPSRWNEATDDIEDEVFELLSKD